MKKIRKAFSEEREQELRLLDYATVCRREDIKNIKLLQPINTKVGAIFNVPTVGTYNILCYRDASKYFDLTQLEKIVVDGKIQDTISYSFNFETTGLHYVDYYFKKELNTISLARMFDSYQNNFAQLKYLDVTKLEKVLISSLFCFCQYCIYLEKIDGASFLNTSICTNIGDVFNHCFSLTDVGDLEKWDVSNVTYMYASFNSCSGLTSLGDLTHWNVSNVTNMQNMFVNCSGLTSIGDLSGWNTSACTTMQSMFSNCSALTSIGDLSLWNTSACTSIGWMFYNCRKITTLGNLDNWDVSQVSTMKSMFYYCAALTSIGDLSLWNTSACTDMSFMFYQCLYLPSLGDLGDWDVSHVSSMTSMFDNDNEFFTFGDINKWNTSACTDMSWMFFGCSRLSAITVSDWDVSNVTTVRRMFSYCYAIINLDLSKWDVSKVTDFNWMFERSTNLESVGDLSNWNVSAGTTFESTFNSCDKLTSVGDISNWDMRNARDVRWMFHDAALVNADFHNWETPNMYIVQNLFGLCRELKYVDLYNMTLSGCTGSNTDRMIWDTSYNFSLLTTIVLSWKFFLGTPIDYYFGKVTAWSRESMLESLYTNQFISEGVPGRDISLVKNIYLPKGTYDRLTQADLDLFLTVGLNVTYS